MKRSSSASRRSRGAAPTDGFDAEGELGSGTLAEAEPLRLASVTGRAGRRASTKNATNAVPSKTSAPAPPTHQPTLRVSGRARNGRAPIGRAAAGLGATDERAGARGVSDPRCSMSADFCAESPAWRPASCCGSGGSDKRSERSRRGGDESPRAPAPGAPLASGGRDRRRPASVFGFAFGGVPGARSGRFPLLKARSPSMFLTPNWGAPPGRAPCGGGAGGAGGAGARSGPTGQAGGGPGAGCKLSKRLGMPSGGAALRNASTRPGATGCMTVIKGGGARSPPPPAACPGAPDTDNWALSAGESVFLACAASSPTMPSCVRSALGSAAMLRSRENSARWCAKPPKPTETERCCNSGALRLSSWIRAGDGGASPARTRIQESIYSASATSRPTLSGDPGARRPSKSGGTSGYVAQSVGQ